MKIESDSIFLDAVERIGIAPQQQPSELIVSFREPRHIILHWR